MRLPHFVLAVCLVGAASGSLWLLGSAPPPPPLTPDATQHAAADAAPAPALEGLGRQPADDDEPIDEPIDGSADDAERTAAPLPPPRGAPRVQVVRGSPGVPVAGAVVHFVRDAEAAERAARSPQLAPPTRWELPAVFGQRAETDADGMVRLPAGQGAWLVSAAHGGDFGVLSVPARDRTHTLVLAADEQVVLRAVGPDDAPVGGLPVLVVQQFGRSEAAAIWRGTTRADGRAFVRHFQLVRETRNNAPTPRFAAFAALPGAEAVAFDGPSAAADELVLRVPALGSATVQVVDHQGLPVLSAGSVGLLATAAPLAPDGMRIPSGLVAPRADKPLGDAPVVLSLLPVADSVRAFARFPLDRRQAESAPTPGPAAPGQRIAIAVPLRDQQLLLAGRFVLAGGAPFAGDVDGALWQHDREVLALRLGALADGRFDVVLAQRPEQAEHWLELRCQPPARSGDRQGPAPAEMLGARVRLPRLLGGRRYDLGTIELGPLAPCVTGLVVDDEAQPVADAEVQVQQELPPAQGERPRDPWRPLPLYRTRSAADGSFAIPGRLPPGTLRVRADTDAHFAASVPLHAQGQDVRIRIDRNGILRGRVLLPDWLPAGAASLVLQPFDPAARERDTRSVDLTPQRGGRFVVEPLRPGRFDALVMVRNLPQPLATIADVFVTPGEARDPRLRALDLRSALHRYRLRAVDAAGQPFPLDGPILARFANLDGSSSETAFRWQRGRAEVIAGTPTAELTFFGRGHQTVRTLLGAGDHDVRLPATRPALVELPGLRALCGPQRAVRVSVLLQGDTGLPETLGGLDQRTGERFGFARWDLGRSSGAWLGDADTVEIPLLQSGRYQVLVRPHATASDRSPQGEVALGVHELRIDGASWSPTRVAVDVVAVGAALQRLDQAFAQAQARGQADAPRRGNAR
jgi:hypothetical protein